MSRRYQHDLIAIERTCDGDPVILTIGNGIWISVGWNDAGLNLTGNELSPNDERVGIPREIQVRAMLRERTLSDMVGVALHPDRASSYNNVLVDAAAAVVNVEGSATAVEIPAGRRRAISSTRTTTSAAPCSPTRATPRTRGVGASGTRAPRELLAGRARGSMTMDALRGILSDHEQAPDSLCRHEADGAHDRHGVLVRRRRHRRVDSIRPRQPLRLRGAGVPIRVRRRGV